MKKNHSLILLSLMLALVLALTGCGQSEAAETTAAPTAATEAVASTAATEAAAETTAPAETSAAAAEVLGEGATVFTLEVTDLEGKVSTFEIHTDKKTVGEALQEVGLVEGEVGQYGLYITTVNGIALDWDKDNKYWAFYIDGEYALTSVDSTEIAEGSVYSLKAE